MSIKIPEYAQSVREIPYPSVRISTGHATFVPMGESPNRRMYIFDDELAKAIEKTKGLGTWAFWPPEDPEYIVFESRDAATIFRLNYNP